MHDLGTGGDVLLLAPHPRDPHPDHRAVGRAAARVGARLGIPVWHFRVWMTYWSEPDVDLGGRLVTVDVDAADDRAWEAAVRCFATQLEPQRPGWGAVVPPAMLAHHDRQLLVLPLEEIAVSGPPDFDAIYRANPDPWDVGASPYEQRKRAVVPPGCGARVRGRLGPGLRTGHLTADLAGRCDRVVASDASATAARLAAERCAGLAVDVSHRALPEAPADGVRPDLVLLSEVFYYLSDAERAATLELVDARAAASPSSSPCTGTAPRTTPG